MAKTFVSLGEKDFIVGFEVDAKGFPFLVSVFDAVVAKRTNIANNLSEKEKLQLEEHCLDCLDLG